MLYHEQLRKVACRGRCSKNNNPAKYKCYDCSISWYGLVIEGLSCLVNCIKFNFKYITLNIEAILYLTALAILNEILRRFRTVQIFSVKTVGNNSFYVVLCVIINN